MANPTMEPQAYGHIILRTTFGDLEVELFTKYCPKLTKNFVQLCLDGYYQNSIFNHVEKDFIAIGGVRTDDIDSLNKHLQFVKDEFHSRLRFTRRGLLASANREKDSNGPEFFFTLGPCQELQNKHSIFGRLKGTSVYTLVDLNECQVNNDLKPLSEKKITQVTIVDNPFPELAPRPEIVTLIRSKDKAKAKKKAPDVPKLGINPNKKLSYLRDEDDESDEEIHPQKSSRNDTEKISHSSRKSKFPIDKDKRKELFGESSADDVKRVRSDTDSAYPESTREKRIREVREQIENFRKQLECESATKIRTLSERRYLKGDQSKTASSDSPLQTLDSHKSKRDRERETDLVVENFRKKLKEIHRPTDSRHRKKSELNASQCLERYETEDARLLEDLDSIDGDSWLTHKFEPIVSSTKDDNFSKAR